MSDEKTPREPGEEAKAIAESWMQQHEHKLMIVAIGAREAMVASLTLTIQRALDKAADREAEAIGRELYHIKINSRRYDVCVSDATNARIAARQRGNRT